MENPKFICVRNLYEGKLYPLSIGKEYKVERDLTRLMGLKYVIFIIDDSGNYNLYPIDFFMTSESYKSKLRNDCITNILK